MTRRVVIAIIINVWLVLITAGCSTYFITRSLLLADLDETIAARVASLPAIARPDSAAQAIPDVQDRYFIKDKTGQRVSSLVPAAAASGPPPVILTREFVTLSDGTRLRSLTLRAFTRSPLHDEPLEEVTVVYSAPTKHIDALLHSLLYSFSFFGILAAIASALAANSAAKAALRPMRNTAELLGKIDERSLNRRVDVATLPPELAPIGAKLNDMLARLETAFAQRRQFIADASHELRTPVAALVTALEVALRRKREAPDYARVLEQTLSDARLLNQLVVALIEQARAERFGENPDYGPVDLDDFLHRCTALVLPLVQRKSLNLEWAVDGSAPSGHAPCNDITLFTDESMLRSAIVNLLSNAVEYTPERGTITLAAHLTDSSDPLPEALRKALPEGLSSSHGPVTGRPGRLLVVVRDTGPGIPPAHLPNVFEPFYRANAARNDSSHHLGLGLALVRMNIRALGGDCCVHSPPPGATTGCEFRVELPTFVIRSEIRAKRDGLTAAPAQEVA
jgi:signal transduction histidine kinase